MLRVSKAILHVFDFETGAKYFSDTALDLEDRQTRSYVQRRLRKITSNPESRHGAFAEKSNFAGGLQEYAAGDFGFVEFSVQIAQWFWENLRKADETEQCDLLVADYLDTDAKASLADASDTAGEDSDVSDASGARVADEVLEGNGRRLFAIVVLPRRQSFIHDVLSGSNEILKQDATLPSPTQKVDTYAVIDLDTGAIDFHGRERSMAGQSKLVMPELFLQCSSEASSHEVISEVTEIVQDLAEEYGLEPAVEVSRAKAAVAAAVEVDETVDPVKVGRRVFEDRPEIQERYEAQAVEKRLPEEISVKRGPAGRIARNHKIRTDTGIEITFPSEMTNHPGLLEFIRESDGRMTISIKNVAHIENR